MEDFTVSWVGIIVVLAIGLVGGYAIKKMRGGRGNL